ncbi:MAG: hypothetical protein IH987_18195, partial [Planctomycetes bacterium]|nr:hypothetical protein [Planctomycetota bacterium]
MFVDIGQYICHWIALAVGEGFRVHVVDYARLEVPFRELGLERGVLAALREFRDQMCKPGWMDADGKTRRSPDQVWIDAGWQGERDELDFVYSFCTESNDGNDARGIYRPTLGRGAGMHGFRQPAKRTPEVPHVGDGYYIARASRDKRRVYRVYMNADYWKTFVHARLSTPVESPGAMTL